MKTQIQNLRYELSKFKNSLINKINPKEKINNDYNIIIYQMGKVGSSSIYNSLCLSKIKSVCHFHRLNPDNIKKVAEEHSKRGIKVEDNDALAEVLYKQIIQKKKKFKIITLVREPISRNISAFFQNFTIFTGKEYQKDNNYDMDKLIQCFLSEYNHSVPLEWFDKELNPVCNIYIYAHAFPINEGYQYINKDNIEILVLKTELNNAQKEEQIANFLNIANFKIEKSNVSSEKIYSETYQNFLEKIILPKEYIDKMLNSKYTQHFYTQEEIDQIHLKWSK